VDGENGRKGPNIRKQRRIKRGGRRGEERMKKEKRKQRKVIYMKH